MQRLKVSKYLRIVPREDDFAVYHSLFGNLELIDLEGKKLLEAFETAKSFERVADAFGKYNSSKIWSFVNDMRSRNFLIEDGYDESELVEDNYKYRKQWLRSGYLVRALQLVLSNLCNFKCEYCFIKNMYNSKERAELQNLSSNMKMSFDVARQSINNLIDLLKRNGNRYLSVEFFGGEPLLNWPVIELVLETFKNGTASGVEIIYSITTNGFLITKKMAEIFKNYGVTVTVSFDAPSKIEKYVVKKEKGGEQVRRNLEILKKNDNWVTFNSVISKETMDEFDGNALVDIAKYYNVRMIGLILDLDLKFYESRGNKNKVIEALFSTYQYGKSQGIPIVGYWHQIFNQIIGKQPLNLFSGYKTCPATGCKLSVEPNGHMFICKCCSGCIGHISKLDHVLSSPQYESYAMRAYRNSPDCGGCEIEGFCSGVCMGSLEKKYSKMDVIEKSSCEVFLGITKKLIENLSENEVEVNYLSKPQREKQ